jgi:hypothetical protein
LVRKHPKILGEMEVILATAVIPELASSEGFLRARACSVFEKYGYFVEFNDGQNLKNVCYGVAGCMQAPELPVRVMAASALSSILRHEAAQDL